MDWIDELDPGERSQWDAFVDHFRRDAVEKIAGSGVFLSLVPRFDHFDVKFAAELGAAIMFDKPLIVVTMPGAEIPRKLRDIADWVIQTDIDTQEGRDALAHALAEIAEEAQ